MTTSVKTFLVERIDETISGVTAPFVVKLCGDNLDASDRKAQEITLVLGSIRGAASVRVESPSGIPEPDVKLKLAPLNR